MQLQPNGKLHRARLLLLSNFSGQMLPVRHGGQANGACRRNPFDGETRPRSWRNIRRCPNLRGFRWPRSRSVHPSLIRKAGRRIRRAFWCLVSGAAPRDSGAAPPPGRPGCSPRCCSQAALLQLAIQYRLNYWSRDFFDAFGRRDGPTLQAQALIFLPLAGSSICRGGSGGLGPHDDPAHVARLADPAPDRSLAGERPLSVSSDSPSERTRTPNTGSPRTRAWRRTRLSP